MSHRQRPKHSTSAAFRVRCQRCRKFTALVHAAQYEWGFLCARCANLKRAMDEGTALDARKGEAA